MRRPRSRHDVPRGKGGVKHRLPPLYGVQYREKPCPSGVAGEGQEHGRASSDENGADAPPPFDGLAIPSEFDFVFKSFVHLPPHTLLAVRPCRQYPYFRLYSHHNLHPSVNSSFKESHLPDSTANNSSECLCNGILCTPPLPRRRVLRVSVSLTLPAITARIIVDGERHVALKSMRPRDEEAESALERVGGYPGFMRARRVPAARNHGLL